MRAHHGRQGGVQLAGTVRVQQVPLDPKAGTARASSLTMGDAMGWVGWRRTVTRVTPGTASLSHSNCFPMNAALRPETSVIVPPGRTRLLTNPPRLGISQGDADDGAVTRPAPARGDTGCASGD
jgi:hypothetical protein